MKKVPNKAVSERTPVVPFRDGDARDRDARGLKGQKNNQAKTRPDTTVQRIKGPGPKVALSGPRPDY